MLQHADLIPCCGKATYLSLVCAAGSAIFAKVSQRKYIVMRKCLVILAALTIPANAMAKSSPNSPASSKFLDDVIACFDRKNDQQRLLCYDGSVNQLKIAKDKQDITVVDRKQVQDAKRSLFGFNVTGIPIFGGNKGAQAAQSDDNEISASITSARQDGQGSWVVTLDNGAVWHQTDDAALSYNLKPGMPLTIRKGALGTYFARTGNRPGFKVKRDS